MAMAQAAAGVEKVIGHGSNAITQQDVTSTLQEGAGDNSDTMLALTWQGKNSVEVQRVPKPRILESRDVILKVTGSTVCGSDLHLLHGAILQLEKGDILGHEFCGIVDEFGDDVKNLNKGQRVVASFQIACGDCFFCKQGFSSQCENTNSNRTEKKLYGGRTAGMFGYSHLTGGFAGGQAEYVRVPLGDVNLLPLPDDVPDEAGLYLSDVLATSYNAVFDTPVYKGDIVAIWGAGPIGQMAAAFAWQFGASRVIMIDQNWRLQFCQSKMPKLEVIDYSALPKGQNVVTKLKEMTNNRGPDCAIECVAGEYAKGWAHYFEMLLGMETDTSEIVNEMIESVRNYGRCGITGVYAGFTNHFNIGALMERGIRLVGNGQAPVHKYWKDLLKQIQEDKLDVLQMVSHRVDIADLDKVYYKFEKKEDGIQKVFVQTKFSSPPAKGAPELTRF